MDESDSAPSVRDAPRARWRRWVRSVRTLAIGGLGVGLFMSVPYLAPGIFSNSGFMPHGHCYLWTPSLVWTTVVSDLLIGLAYLSISICLYVLVRRINLPFSAMFLAFGVFIAACGTGHFMDVYTLWYPNYWQSAFVRVITAVASVATAIIMFPLFPHVIGFAAAARLSEERKRQLEELNRQLELRGEELTAANRELEAFSYSVSHDLRTPLRGIDGFAKALIEDYGTSLDKTGNEYLRFVRDGAERMGVIIDDLLNLSRITRTELARHPLDLSRMAREVITLLERQNPGRQVETFVQDGARAAGDRGLIRLVFENLLSNAWKFTAKSVGARVEFGFSTEGGCTTYFVRDNGIGFDMTYSHKLFGAFQRLHAAEDYAGTGVGLATARRIIDRHGGRIWADSAVGRGTTFYFRLGGLGDDPAPEVRPPS